MLALTPTELHIDSLARWLIEDDFVRSRVRAGEHHTEVERRLGVIARRLSTTRTHALQLVLEHAIEITNKEL